MQWCNSALVICPLCGTRKARRACPALGRNICPVCCGTKRLVEIRCPSDCTYLTSAREHPPATVVRQQQRDVGLIAHVARDLTRHQSELFLVLCARIGRYRPPEIQPLFDGDVEDAATALAATFETASSGLIYEHRPGSGPAERLAAAIRPFLSELATRGGSSFERDAAVVLRRIAAAVHEMGQANSGNQRAFLELLGRLLDKLDPSEQNEATEPEPPRLILP